jgi:hypothetical protein
LDEFFEGYERSRLLFDALVRVIHEVGFYELRITKSQIAFRRKKNFAWVWIPGRYLGGNRAPLVFTLSLASRDNSPRWKEIIEPVSGRFVHHLELYSKEDIDDEIHQWSTEAWMQG